MTFAVAPNAMATQAGIYAVVDITEVLVTPLDVILVNQNDTCHPFGGSSTDLSEVSNDTNGYLELYSAPGCNSANLITTVNPFGIQTVTGVRSVQDFD